MTPAAQSWRETERQFLEQLRPEYEREGYTFIADPGDAQLPDFLDRYRPDAIAVKNGRNIAIEVKSRQVSSAQPSLTRIRQLFEGRPDWKLRVIFVGGDPYQADVPASTPETIRRRAANIRALLAQGHHQPAFVMAWSLLEAAFRSLEENSDHRSYTPGTVVQTLATYGRITPDMERELRGLIRLRNRIVHGDLEAAPTKAEVEQVLSGAEAAIQPQDASLL